MSTGAAAEAARKARRRSVVGLVIAVYPDPVGATVIPILKIRNEIL
jgi:hypothetical protein